MLVDLLMAKEMAPHNPQETQHTQLRAEPLGLPFMGHRRVRRLPLVSLPHYDMGMEFTNLVSGDPRQVHGHWPPSHFLCQGPRLISWTLDPRRGGAQQGKLWLDLTKTSIGPHFLHTRELCGTQEPRDPSFPRICEGPLLFRPPETTQNRDWSWAMAIWSSTRIPGSPFSGPSHDP